MKKKVLCIITTLILFSLAAGCTSLERTSNVAGETIVPTAPTVNSIETTTATDNFENSLDRVIETDNENATLVDQEQQPEKTSSAPKASDTPAKAEEPAAKPQKTEKPETAATKAPQTPAATKSPEFTAPVTPKPTPKPTPEPTQEPTPTPEPEPEMEIMGGSFNSAVLTAVNAARAEYGNAPLVLDSGLCAKALAHAKEMAERGEIFHSCGGAESVSNAAGSGSTIGTRSAAHATGLALDADRSRLGVGSVKIGDKQYTCVFSPRD